MAWPMEEPTATPLQTKNEYVSGVFWGVEKIYIARKLPEVEVGEKTVSKQPGRDRGYALTQRWRPSGRRDRDQRSAGERPAWEERAAEERRRSSEAPAAGKRGPDGQEQR